MSWQYCVLADGAAAPPGVGVAGVCVAGFCTAGVCGAAWPPVLGAGVTDDGCVAWVVCDDGVADAVESLPLVPVDPVDDPVASAPDCGSGWAIGAVLGTWSSGVDDPPQAVRPPAARQQQLTAIAVRIAQAAIGPMRRPHVGQSLRSFWAS